MELNERLMEIEKVIPLLQERDKNFDKLIKQNNEVLSSLNTSFNENQKAMVEISHNMRDMANEIISIKSDIKEIKDERSLNIMVWLKSNFISIATLVGLIGYLIK